MTQSAIFALCAGGLILGFIAVIVDRLNFPQKRFVARGIRATNRRTGPIRDRTGAHIVELSTDPNEADQAPKG